MIKENLQWHPAFFAGMQIEFGQEAEFLTFENEHSLGYVEQLDNDDGCIRLVYDLEKYGSNADYTTFANVAYVYVCEENEPGFKHTTAQNESFNTSRYNDYIISFRGSALGRELNFTLRDLENLVVYDENGNVVPGGVGYTNHYSLANTTYWYVNEYEGLDLYKMLLYLGMDDAEPWAWRLPEPRLLSSLPPTVWPRRRPSPSTPCPGPMPSASMKRMLPIWATAAISPATRTWCRPAIPC